MKHRHLLFAAASAASLLTTGAVAQTGAGAGEVEELVVTGTRTEGRSRLETLAPVDVISDEALQRQGTTELGAALATLAPSIDFPRPAITDGTDSVRPATLRGLAPDHTLVLVNGLRRHSSALVNVNGSIGRGSAAVDLNAIPTVALDRVEVLRDGASAQYGSDAIAGVINLRLRQAREGGSASVVYGYHNTEVETARIPQGYRKKDGVQWTVSGWKGLPIGEEGYLTVAAEYRMRNPTSRGDLDPRPARPSITSRYGDPQAEDITLYANAGVPLQNGWELYGWAGVQNRETDSAANPRLANNPNNVRAIFPDGFLPRITTDIDDYTFAAGIRGDVGGFTVDVSAVYGYNKVRYGVVDSVNASLDRASPTTFDAGAMEYDQWVLGADFTRPLDFGLAGPATLAFGFEGRFEGYAIQAGDLASYVLGPFNTRAAGAQGFPGFKPSNEVDKHRHSYAAYVDVELPLTDAFDVDLAARFEDYSDFGSTLTGKVSARYEVTDALAFRGTASTGFRAPSLQQQYFTATSTNFISIGGVNTPVEVSTFPATSVTAAALGAQPLDAEDSVNFSLGFVYQRGPFELTVDAYRIEIDDRIVLSENILGSPTGSPTAQAIFRLLNPPGTSGIGGARFFINGVDTTTRGIDAVLRYRLDLDTAGRFDMTLASNWNRTKVTKVPTTAPLQALPVPPILFDRANRLTFEEGTPEQKHSFSVDWSLGGWGATAKATYYGDVLTPNNSPALDYHSGYDTLVDLEVRYGFEFGLNVALGVNNLFDAYPNATPTRVNTNGPLGFPSYSPFGFNGRFLYARVGYDF